MGLSEIWPFHPEKCLAVRADWACEQPEALIRLMRALIQAQVICDLPAEADSIAASLAVADGLAQPRDAVRAALAGWASERIWFHGVGAGLPARPHALWFLRQMPRWGWLEERIDLNDVAGTVYRPDLFSRAVCSEG